MKKPLKSNRDNFTSKTIEIAAKRVGYRCSFPGCGALTIGPGSDEKHPTAKTGQGAHICAAAPGGPRYDKDMGPEERKSESNCIWLCENHARLIDVDPARYSVEKLRQWKKEAEEKARQELEAAQKQPLFPNGEASVGGDLVCQLIDPLIQEGRYPEALACCLKLEEMSLTVLAQDRLKFYYVVLAFYCDKAALESRLDACLSRQDPALNNDLARFFVEMGDVLHIKKTLPTCTDSLVVSFGQRFIDQTLEGFFLKEPSLPDIKDPKEKRDRSLFLSKLCSSYFIGKKQNILDQEGKEAFFLGEFYFKVMADALLAVIAQRDNSHALNPKLKDDPHYVFLKQSLDKISHFDPEILSQVWFAILYFASFDDSEFKSVSALVPESIRTDPEIKEILISADFHFPCSPEEESALIDFALQEKKINPLCRLLTSLLDSNPKRVNELFDQHPALFEIDPFLFSYAFVAWKNLGTKGKILPLLDHYDSLYSNDLLFHCLCYQAAYWELDKTRMAKEKNYLLAVPFNPAFPRPGVLLNTYGIAGLYQKVKELALAVSDPNLQNLGLEFLLDSGDPAYGEAEKTLIDSLLKTGYVFDSETALGLFEKTQRHLAEADEHFLKAVKENHSLRAAGNSLVLHDNQKQEQNPEAVAIARTSSDARVLTIVASFYASKGETDEAQAFYAKAIFRNPDETVALGRYFTWKIVQKHPDEDNKPSFVCRNSVLTLKGLEQTPTVIAYVDPALLEGIGPTRLGDCRVFGSDDPKVSSLSLAKLNSQVSFEGKEYTITAISDFWIYLLSFARDKLLATKSIKAISAGDDPVGTITKLLTDSSRSNQELLQEFNKEGHPPFPLEFLGGIFGDDEIKTLNFLLYRNEAPFVNNPNSSIPSDDLIYVLSYDALFFLYSLGLSKTNLPWSFIVPNLVDSSLRNDLAEEKNSLRSSDTTGSLVLENGQAKRLVLTPEQKKQGFEEVKRFESLISSFPCSAKTFDPHFDEKGEMVKDLIELRTLVENDSIGLCQSQKDKFVLISDDPFLYSLASFAHVPTLGIVGLLEKSTLDFHGLLNAILALESYPNFDNYLTPALLNHLHSLCRNQKDSEDFLAFLSCKDLTEEKRMVKRKKQVIRCILAERDHPGLYPKELQSSLNSFLVPYYSQLEPEKFQKIMDETFGSPISIKVNFAGADKEQDSIKKDK